MTADQRPARKTQGEMHTGCLPRNADAQLLLTTSHGSVGVGVSAGGVVNGFVSVVKDAEVVWLRAVELIGGPAVEVGTTVATLVPMQEQALESRVEKASGESPEQCEAKEGISVLATDWAMKVLQNDWAELRRPGVWVATRARMQLSAAQSAATSATAAGSSTKTEGTILEYRGPL